MLLWHLYAKGLFPPRLNLVAKAPTDFHRNRIGISTAINVEDFAVIIIAIIAIVMGIIIFTLVVC